MVLSQLARLSIESDGRYATKAELIFLKDYLRSASMRLAIYQKLQNTDKDIVSQVEAKMLSMNPNFFRLGGVDITAKWRADTFRVLRYISTAVLINDPQRLRDRILTWFEVILSSLNAKETTGVTYKVMQEVIKPQFTVEEQNLLMPILELVCTKLGS
jgi:Phycobilisome protein